LVVPQQLSQFPAVVAAQALVVPQQLPQLQAVVAAQALVVHQQLPRLQAVVLPQQQCVLIERLQRPGRVVTRQQHTTRVRVHGWMGSAASISARSGGQHGIMVIGLATWIPSASLSRWRTSATSRLASSYRQESDKRKTSWRRWAQLGSGCQLKSLVAGGVLTTSCSRSHTIFSCCGPSSSGCSQRSDWCSST